MRDVYERAVQRVYNGNGFGCLVWARRALSQATFDPRINLADRDVVLAPDDFGGAGTYLLPVLVEMGIVNYPVVDFARQPAKGLVAAGTPHLVAAANLENSGAAGGARFGFFANEFGA